ncbi:hypothetical protein NUSPORA_02148 [Nucleospora cyclopteri]
MKKSHGFPKELYKIQEKFIKDATNLIEKGQFGIFSSPTGTGKTISILSTCISFMSNSEDDLLDLMNFADKIKIIYCSRTHTQLNQVMNELNTNIYRYKATILGSRKIYCVNDNVDKTADIEEINKTCHDLIKNDRCGYFLDESKFYQTANMNVEESKIKARENSFCPYYYAKNRASECEIVFLPYNLIFTDEGRKGIDIDLQDKILIVDEAHNIYDTVININSAEISLKEIKKISYSKGIFQNLTEIIKRILYFFDQFAQNESKGMKINDFLIKSNLLQFNMLEIDELIKNEKLAQKNENLPIFEFSRFLKLLTYSDKNGLIVFDQNFIKFTPLFPDIYFDQIKKCKSVIFAGGTMEPVDQLKRIFPNIKYFNYQSTNKNVLPLCIGNSIDNRKIILTYENRVSLIDSVSKTIVALTYPVKSGGIVIFVPSKAFLDLFKKSPFFNFKRKVFYEDQNEFTEFIQEPEILVAVMGGKLSEGVNFSDHLCRLLIVVGIPFPLKTAEYSERVKADPKYAISTAMQRVNQTIGRSVRHKNDFSGVVLLDYRYNELKNYLSPWIIQQLESCSVCKSIELIQRFLKKNN